MWNVVVEKVHPLFRRLRSSASTIFHNKAPNLSYRVHNASDLSIVATTVC